MLYIYMFFEAWNDFRNLQDGFLSHEILSLFFFQINKLIVIFFDFGQVTSVIFLTLGNIQLSASASLLTLGKMQL